jgi:nitronate monooxygenase
VSLAPGLFDRLSLPLIAAPMTAVSTPALVLAACRMGVIGAIPTHNFSTTRELDRSLADLRAALAADAAATAPYAPNLVVHRSNPRLQADLACLISHRPELVITSVGSPAGVVDPLHEVGCQVIADVASIAHARRAVDAGVDGLVLLTAGAGGQTGWANPFAFVRAVRKFYTGTVVLAGGISDGVAVRAALELGADLTYMGTKFIATEESGANNGYVDAVVDATLDDVVLSDQIGGIPASLLRAWIDAEATHHEAASGRTTGFRQDRLLSNRFAWSGGHSVSGVSARSTVADVITVTRREFSAAESERSSRHNWGATLS